MNFSDIKDLATSKVARQVLQTQKHSPKILFAAGVVGVATTVVLAAALIALAMFSTQDAASKFLVDRLRCMDMLQLLTR